MGSPLRALIRAVAYLAFTGILMPAQMVALVINLRWAKRIPMFYHRTCCRILGIRVAVKGEISPVAPTLFVCNHSSYLDIAVLSSVLEASFVSKAEVRNWPLFGTLARLQRTVFIERRPSQVQGHRDEIGKRLDAADNLILFPEGTSTDGSRVRTFRTALFAAAEREVAGAPLTVQPVSVAYTRLDGIPLGRGLRPLYTWFGEMELMPHIWSMLGLGKLTVELEFHPPVTFAQFGTRKALAAHCHDMVAGGLAAANAGAGAAPRPRVAVAA